MLYFFFQIKCIVFSAIVGVALPAIKELSLLVYGFVIGDIVLFCITFLSAILVIVCAVKNRNQKLLLPWLITASIGIVLNVVAIKNAIQNAELKVLLLRLCRLGTHNIVLDTYNCNTMIKLILLRNSL